MNKRFIYVFVVLFTLLIFLPDMALSLEFTTEEQNWLDDVGQLSFSEVDWEPLSYTDEYPIYKGVIADYLQILGESTGLEMVFIQSSTWQDVLDKFTTEDIDFIPALSSEDNIGKEVILTDPYISFPLVIVTRSNIDFISETKELEGKRVGVGKGYTSHSFIKNNYPEIELVTTENVQEGLKLLNKGKIDAFVGHLAIMNVAIKKSHFDLRIAGKTEFVFDHRIGFSTEHARTVLIFNKVLSQITAEEHNRIYNRWIRLNTDKADYSLIWKVLIASLIIISGFIYWNMRIRRFLREMNTLKNELEAKNQRLNILTITDQLTGLYNRLKLDESLQYEALRFARYNHPFGIILIDIDHFKNINDTFGHPTGDKVLESISNLLLKNIRKADTLGRWGGEEFLIICPETDEQDIKQFAEKLRNKIDSFDFPEVHVSTASFGATISRKGDDMTRLMKRVDEALYSAKKNGRNRVIFK
ncbi:MULTISPECIES: diguanylate cyclase [unclassified Oceanispirochaeta]|uniref:transporter substrate-binding domain-containing diguanylate cyclase n=1 Tax=unclassified Oceanispirochaeta TaxID=2635722 RepID=UPI000E08E759|nr:MULTISPECIES: diguanylate cyclase [unclassified Oceanispirochaeta]MBF9014884.1 diguanylate cyclase [Oceanispirochaeta sp. M2]NPD71435.1 diguanylate cyclase [Oceanispirochaeta sp. M1]RDG33396.1 diguanylate cyclase [Oceanispirochaeta sp. M1]